MLLILPPSESKRTGGEEGTALDPGRLSFPELAVPRREVLRATKALARNLSTMAAALKIGPSLQHELQRNREITTSPVMPAIDRFTGVLFDALDAGSLSEQARTFAARTIAIHSALFGLVGALDPIPAYRLSHDSRLPGLSLKKAWSKPIASVLAQQPGLLLDLRSEAYATLGPAPQRDGSLYLRVVAQGADGRIRALNHFNKKGKGEFARAVIEAGIEHPDAASLVDWAASVGFDLGHGRPGELELVVANSVAA
ncbi:hypothetical protein FB562_1601 [Homoserinimonas aerilata]|uniref:Peroxide stress protein YaaA n=1 Tax=Homoserinimonas aerilata TaxID=1162970 RepID=A0A542YK71_9MICO|nr:peroxide stress protein YaaA [Homoserinimonas aerilata]TQL48507.1 hypothetical protein FB562_1601 [Homoserinimonas aerilata]